MNKEDILVQRLRDVWTKVSKGEAKCVDQKMGQKGGLDQDFGPGPDRRSQDRIRDAPMGVKAVFYPVVRGLNAFDRENHKPLSPLNGQIAAEVAWAEYDKERGR